MSDSKEMVLSCEIISAVKDPLASASTARSLLQALLNERQDAKTLKMFRRFFILVPPTSGRDNTRENVWTLWWPDSKDHNAVRANQRFA